LLLAAYGGLQDWDGLWLFDYGQGNPAVSMGYVRGFFEIAQHPTKMPNLLLAANLFRRGDVRPATQEITMALTPERELDLVQNSYAWELFSSRQLGLSGKHGLISRINTSVGTNAVGLTVAPPAPTSTVLSSDTGELKWDVSQSGRGLVTVDTPRTKAVIGFADNRTVNLGGLSFRSGTTQLGWATLGITLVQGEVFTNDCTALILATGWWENTGQIWTDTNRNSVANHWGTSPVLAEVVPFTVTLPVGTNYVSVWSLDERGQRKAAVSVSGTSSSTTITVSTNAASTWYEVRVARWMTSFDLWRLRYFSAAELGVPEISGAGAAPDGDGVVNLWKYYLGLEGRTFAATAELPVPAVVQAATDQFLTLSWNRDKLASDVNCLGEVSANLRAWFSGPEWTSIDSITAIDGQRERVTLRDLTPLSAASAHYLRLQLQWASP
jgi:hypothetical protein